jgi:hypothetical protein
MLQRGEQVPHFAVTTVDGRPVAYRDIWQRQNLLLVTAGADEPAGPGTWVARLASQAPAVASHDAVLVITRDLIPGIALPAVVVADRWGEIQTVLPRRVSEGPALGEILDWMSYVQSRCPECEGEAR